jgi:aminoglycoside 6'-N-acetyltransferase I
VTPSHESWTVERIGAGDAAKLSQIAPEVFASAVEARFLEAYLAEPLMLLVVARAGELVIGQAKCAVHRHPEKPADGYIDDLRVTPEYQRRGVARAMLREVERWAGEKGCSDLWLAADPDNASATIFYDGFATAKVCLLYYWNL